jgi:hypothetical protein
VWETLDNKTENIFSMMTQNELGRNTWLHWWFIWKWWISNLVWLNSYLDGRNTVPHFSPVYPGTHSLQSRPVNLGLHSTHPFSIWHLAQFSTQFVQFSPYWLISQPEIERNYNLHFKVLKSPREVTVTCVSHAFYHWIEEVVL